MNGYVCQQRMTWIGLGSAEMSRGGCGSSYIRNRNIGGCCYCVIDPLLLKACEESHQISKAQSDTAHIDRKHEVSIKRCTADAIF